MDEQRHRIGLISCSAQKLGHAAPARELYCSPLFRKSLAYAEARCERVYVLSARHHLVELDQVLEPYEQRLSSIKRERKQWGNVVAGGIETRHGRHKHDLLILAGEDYASGLLAHVAFWWPPGYWRKHILTPLAGLQFGERLRWLNEQLARSAACEHEVTCVSCGAPGVGPGAVRLDLDVSATPPEHICVRCKRKPRCLRCGLRRNRLTVQPGSRTALCEPCIRESDRLEAERCRRSCTACGGATSVELTNEHGECPDCSVERLYREHPIARTAA